MIIIWMLLAWSLCLVASDLWAVQAERVEKELSEKKEELERIKKKLRLKQKERENILSKESSIELILWRIFFVFLFFLFYFFFTELIVLWLDEKRFDQMEIDPTPCDSL